MGGAVLVGLSFALFGPWLIDLLSTAPEVRAAARDYLPWLVLAPILGNASWMFDGIFIGATLTGRMRRAMIEAVAIYVLALLVLVPAFGNHGLWAALMVLNVARALTMARFYPEAVATARRGAVPHHADPADLTSPV